MARLATRKNPNAFLRLSEVADSMRLSLAYLEEIASALKQAGLVEGRKGPKGGYRLLLPPEKISLEDMFTALEGPVALVKCQSDVVCDVSRQCPSKGVWGVLRKSLVKVLRETSLKDLVKETVA